MVDLDHKRDAARAENSLTLTFGSELIGMQRDWNEELQACREFPHATHQEKCASCPWTNSLQNIPLWIYYIELLTIHIYCRILRDRALYKVTSDFVDAATSGAIGVISRCIPPINPTDPECFHMWGYLRKKCFSFYCHCPTYSFSSHWTGIFFYLLFSASLVCVFFFFLFLNVADANPHSLCVLYISFTSMSMNIDFLIHVVTKSLLSQV